MQQNPKISHWVITGDSLTDRGEMSHRTLLGIISMSFLSGLAGKSPLGRFTNRFTWADHFISLVIQKLKNEATKDTNEVQADEKLIKSHQFDDYLYIGYQGHQDFVRCYAEGGLTSHDYSWTPSKSFSRFFSRILLATLGGMREKLLNWDHVQKVSKKQKAQTLVIEWSGANDLITVNEKPSEAEAKQAVKDRIKNVKKLIKKGYQHFALFNLPDLSLTPRFQDPKKSQADRDNASRCSALFNEELEKARKELLELYPHCSIDIFDVNSLFKQAHANPQEYGFDPELKDKSYCDSKDFKDMANDPKADKYLFWNDVHPSDRLHKLLADAFKQEFEQKYNFVEPRSIKNKEAEKPLPITTSQLLHAFRKKYQEKLHKDVMGWFGFFRHSKISYQTASLQDILRHALYEGGARTRDVIKDLQWIDHQGKIQLNIPALQSAMKELENSQNPLHRPDASHRN